jgi:hypothetical protein
LNSGGATSKEPRYRRQEVRRKFQNAMDDLGVAAAMKAHPEWLQAGGDER